jgi:hypothetical protein
LWSKQTISPVNGNTLPVDTTHGNARQWWSLSRGYTVLLRVFLLTFGTFSVSMALDPLWGRSIMSAWFAAYAVVFCYLCGRFVVVGIAFDEDALFVRRLLPGRVERVSISRVGRCLYLQLLRLAKYSDIAKSGKSRPEPGKNAPVHCNSYMRDSIVAPAVGSVADSVVLVGWSFMPMNLNGTYHPVPRADPDSEQADGSVLARRLHDVFQPAGKWRVVRMPFQIRFG